MKLVGILCIACLAFLPAAVSAETVVYVAPNGNDAWTGGLDAPNAAGNDGPVSTPGRARDRVRELKAGGATGPVQVLFREGTYRLTNPLALGPEDSGAYDAPVAYAAYPGEHPVLSGGILAAGWTPEGPLWKCTLDADRAPAEGFRALWVNGELRGCARTPNEGYYTTAGKLGEPQTTEQGQKINPNGFLFDAGNIEAWPDLDDALVVTLHSWDLTYFRVQSVDAEKHEVRFTDHPSWAFENWGPKQRYFVENTREALDQPGEWYYNRKARTLYYYPKPGETPENTEVVVPVLPQVVRVAGDAAQDRFVEYVAIDGLGFAHTNAPVGPRGMNNAQAAYPVDAAIQANGLRYSRIENCTVSNISNYAIWLDFGCQHNRIARNHLHHLGAGGVRLGDGADPATPGQASAWNEVDNNWIHHGGLLYQAGIGVWLGRTSYNTVSHNDISDFYYTGVSLGWSWGYAASSANHNTIEFNHIHHLGKRLLSDLGGIYALGIAPGTILRNNLIHDVYSFSYGGWGIYPDEGSTDLLIENNVVYNTKTGGFHQHYGRENRVFNNVFAFAEEDQIMRTREEEHVSFFFEHNIVFCNNGRLLGSNWKNGNFRMDQNCYWDASGAAVNFKENDFDAWRKLGHDRRSIVADPLFENAAAFDFRLKKESPARALGIHSINVSRAGLYGAEEWRIGPASLAHE